MKFQQKLQSKNNNLRCISVTYSDGRTEFCDMAAHLTDDEMKNYFGIGKKFNVGIENDVIIHVTKTEILI